MCTVCDRWNGKSIQAQYLSPDTLPRSAVSDTPVKYLSESHPYKIAHKGFMFYDKNKKNITWSNAKRNINRRELDNQIQYHLEEDELLLVRQAFRLWASTARLNFVEVADSLSVDIRIGKGDLQENNILARAAASIPVPPKSKCKYYLLGLIPICFLQARDRLFGNFIFNVGFNRDQYFLDLSDEADRQQFLHTAVHEIGHVLGLEHSDVKAAVMYYRNSRFDGIPAALHQDDINGIRELYPGEAGFPSRSWVPLGELTTEGMTRSITNTMAPNEDDHKYHFTLTKPSTIQIRLSSSANADLFLIESSGRGIPHGEIIGKSTKGYGKNEFQFIYTIPDELIYTLPAGGYEIRVRSAEKNYAFLYELSTQTLYFDNRPPPGTTRLTAIDLGDFSSAKVLQYTKIQTLEPETGDDDRFYRFTLTEDRGMVISVNHRNTDNADLSLLDASGRTLRHSANFGTNSEWLYPTLTKGTYFVRVDAPFGETVKYQLGYASYFPRNLGDLAHLEPGDILTETGEFHGTASYDGLRWVKI